MSDHRKDSALVLLASVLSLLASPPLLLAFQPVTPNPSTRAGEFNITQRRKVEPVTDGRAREVFSRRLDTSRAA